VWTHVIEGLEGGGGGGGVVGGRDSIGVGECKE
jgi:hypothetical protein